MVCWLPLQVEPGDFGSILSLFGNRMKEEDASLALLRDFPGPGVNRRRLLTPDQKGAGTSIYETCKVPGSLNPRKWVREVL